MSVTVQGDVILVSIEDSEQIVLQVPSQDISIQLSDNSGIDVEVNEQGTQVFIEESPILVTVEDDGVTVVVSCVESESTEGIPAGGTEGQVLTKASGTDYDAEWRDPEAKRLSITKKATHNISALKVLKFDSSDYVSYATSNTTFEDATAIGISLTAATTGNDVEILLFGVLEDPFFSFPVNAGVYLTTSGGLSDTPPVSGYLSKVGNSLGTGAIFFKSERAISL